MASLKPFKKATIQGLFEHDGRKDDKHSHSNKDIDVTKSYLNYDLCQKQGTVYERFKKRLSEVKCLARDDVNVIDSLVVHLPEDVKKVMKENSLRVFMRSLVRIMKKKI